MYVLDLFSGIGGFSLGLERAGMRTVAFCEIDPYCRAVLARHWPGVPCHDDIRTIPRVGDIDLVCGGFPCQPFSVAGKRKAHKDDRHLWPEMRRVIALERPAWVIGENVPGLVTVGLDDVLLDLESLGYATRTFDIPACAVGAPHKRSRLWIVAHTSRGELRNESGRRSGANGEGPPEPSNHGTEGTMAHTGGQGLSQRPLHAGVPSKARRHDNGQDTSLGGWWDIEPDVGRVADGVPYRVDRLRALGNAVVPQVVEVIGRAIMREQHDH